MALVVLSFILSIGLIFKAVNLISRGASAEIVVKFILGGFPYTLSWTIPFALLVSSLLVFGKLSSDSEIMAMRACGVSLFDIMRMPLLIALFLSVCCLYINNTISPESSYSRKLSRNAIGVNEVAALIEPGKTITNEKFGTGISIFVKKRNKNHLTDVRIVEPMDNDSNSYRELTASTAIMTSEENNSVLHIDLNDVVIKTFSAEDTKDMTSVTAKSMPFKLFFKDEKRRNKAPTRRPKDKPSWQLAADIELFELFPSTDKGKLKNICRSRVEIYSRITLALACVCFVLIGTPLGIQQHRKETWFGLVLSLGVGLSFYLFIILANSLVEHLSQFAHIIVLFPIFICLGLGVYLIKKGN